MHLDQRTLGTWSARQSAAGIMVPRLHPRWASPLHVGKCARASALGRPRRGIVLFMVLMILVVLTLAAYRYSELMEGEFRVADSIAQVDQALADSGIQYTAALLSNAGTFSSVLNSAPWDNPAAFQGILVQPNDHPKFRGRFSIVSPPGPDKAPSGSTAFHYGVTDEGGKINLNSLMAIDASGKLLHDTLMALPI